MALGHRMQTLAWVGIASLCLGAAWAVPAKKERKKVEKLKPDLVLYENLDLDNYDVTLDNYGDIMDLNNYEELYDYGDLAPKVRGTGGHTGQGSPWCSLGKEAGVAPSYGPQLVLVGYGWRTDSAPCTTSPGGSSPSFVVGKALPNPKLLLLPCVLPG